MRFNFTASELTKHVEDEIAKDKKALDELAKAEPTWETLLKINDQDSIFSTNVSSSNFLSYVSSDKSVRDAGNEATEVIEKYEIEKSFREDLYALFKTYAETHDESKHTDEENRFLKKTLEAYVRNGMGLEEEQKTKLKAVKTEISELCIKFQQNLNEDKTFVLFSEAELEGMPEDYLKGLDRDGDNYKVSLDYPQLFPLLKKGKKSSTRQKIDLAKEQQCNEANIPLLEKAVALRKIEAKLLGYESHAAYVLAVRMAKTPEKVMTFLKDLSVKMTPGLTKDIEGLLKLKKQECEETGEEYVDTLFSYDYRYYHNMDLEKNYQVDETLVQQYFPLQHVVKALFEIYQEMLSLKFTLLTDNAHVWHEDVTQYVVEDSATGEFMGHFYLDLHPREGKYGHAAEFAIQKGCVIDGVRQYPAAAMVANFTKPVGDKASLLKHQEVVTFAHELGHVLHEVCSTANFQLFAGTNVERDFVETPSQMLENWCYEADILARLSKHNETGESLPESLRLQLVKARHANAFLMGKRQLFFGFFDMSLHSATEDSEIDSGKLWHTLRQEISGIPSPEGSNGSASFGHLMGGYSAGYYGYLWSEVFSADLFQAFKSAGVLNPELGRKYRDLILGSGGKRDSIDVLVEFLGREPTQEPFLTQLGL
eukprot:TRINITY_DN3885_c0_g1_i1.p1 TRINITY_DN3885_c0_g1~~TRINITY_DN3885_c0_g1_i1.p1  ORF type:complete len:676 (+),score=176.61 TRINITY_DN3885_c0_g1_i1:74-2029(+)